MPSVLWKHIERALLLFGVLGAFGALFTGETAEYLIQPNQKLVEIYAFFANLSTWVYSAILLGEIASVVSVARIDFQKRTYLTLLKKVIIWIEKILYSRIFSTILAVVGLIAILLTGMFGGAIVYGATADPLTGIILKLFGIT